MNQITTLEEELSWITLKEAARRLDCSVKTIRRRIKGGTWRSRIEYQGQKAIRLVSREDVLKESAVLNRLPANLPEEALALQALDGLPRELGQVLQSYLGGLKTELDRRALLFRIYLLVSLGLVAILLTGLGLSFSWWRAKILESRIGEMSRTLSTTLSRSESNLAREMSRVSNLAAETREESDRQSRSLEGLPAALNSLENENREAREEIVSLRREVARLEATLRDEERAGEDLGEASATNIENAAGPGTGEPELVPEKKTSRFLGIF